MPLPTILNAQRDRMKLVKNGKSIDVDGREVFVDLYRHVITDRILSRVNVMGTKGIGKSYRLAALVGLLLKQVCIALHIFVCCYVHFGIDMSELVCIFTGPSCGLLAQLRRLVQFLGEPFTFGAVGCLRRRGELVDSRDNQSAQNH